MDYLSENEMITDYARELKINVLQNELEDFITLATQENWEIGRASCRERV